MLSPICKSVKDAYAEPGNTGTTYAITFLDYLCETDEAIVFLRFHINYISGKLFFGIGFNLKEQ